ncbi:MAG: hypothetical protein REI09_13635 [Candidatus Dactylopiibacterium sp.]|nr:hypothetical protein [Candidatus Dactylopiibacterium sp.]
MPARRTPRRTLSAAALLALGLHALPAHAGPAAEALGQCFVESTSSAERETISRWLFIVLAQQPEVKDLATVPASARDATDRAMAQLVERLVTDVCKEPARTALSQEGPRALKQSVEIFAQSAARRTFSEPAVASAINGFTRHLDMTRLLQSFITLRQR